MAQRFSKIRKQIKDGNTGTDLTAWKAWRRGEVKSDPINVARGPSERKMVSPFLLEDFTSHIVIKVSGRAFQALGTVGLTDAQLGLNNVPNPVPSGTTIRRLKNFRPAKIVTFVTAAGQTPTEPKSVITQLNYKKTPGASYTFPFGKRDLEGFRNWLDIVATLEGTLNAGIRASFSPENF